MKKIHLSFTTPAPTTEELARELGVSPARSREITAIVERAAAKLASAAKRKKVRRKIAGSSTAKSPALVRGSKKAA